MNDKSSRNMNARNMHGVANFPLNLPLIVMQVCRGLDRPGLTKRWQNKVRRL